MKKAIVSNGQDVEYVDIPDEDLPSVTPPPSTEDRIAALEAAVLAQILGGA